MKLNNPFSDDTRLLFLYVYSCFLCGRSDRGLELHHIIGRGSSSPLNACPLCIECHSHIGHSVAEQRKLLHRTAVFLEDQNYELTKEDEIFAIQWLPSN